MNKTLSGDNVVAVRFEEESKAYQALSDLKQLNRRGLIALDSAAVVKRLSDGRLMVPEGEDSDFGMHTVTGGLIGLLLGALGGPVGVVLGASAGAIIGTLSGARELDEDEAILAQIGRTFAVGETGLIAQLTETTPDVVDTAMTQLGGTIQRQPQADVIAELEAVEEAMRTAQREANRVLREKRRETLRSRVRSSAAEIRQRIIELDEKGLSIFRTGWSDEAS